MYICQISCCRLKQQRLTCKKKDTVVNNRTDNTMLVHATKVQHLQKYIRVSSAQSTDRNRMEGKMSFETFFIFNVYKVWYFFNWYTESHIICSPLEKGKKTPEVRRVCPNLQFLYHWDVFLNSVDYTLQEEPAMPTY